VIETIMQKANRLLQVMQAASSVAEIVRERQTYQFGVVGEASLYLHLQGTEVRLFRWNRPLIEITAQLQLGPGWRIAHDQDEAGVYFVARRRRWSGGLASATFAVSMPETTHVMLRLERCQVWISDLSGSFDLPAPSSRTASALLPAEV
jgi:hypothetical protein